MTRHGAIELDFADETYTFRLPISGIEELEAKVKRGIFQIADDLDPAVRSAGVKTISEVIRIGLIGGGLQPVDALALTRRYVDERPLHENLLLAYSVVLAGIARVNGMEVPKENPPGEASAAETD
jgi:hypothetical protein